MWEMAPIRKRTRKTAVIGSSMLVEGVPPKPAFVGAYGPFEDIFWDGISICTEILEASKGVG